ncbi:MAG: hypothetical protein ACPGSM_04770 [Thiolinea sp.]
MKKSVVFSGVFAFLIGTAVSAAEVVSVGDGLVDQFQDHGHHNSQDATIGFISDKTVNAKVNVLWGEVIQTQLYGHHNTQEAVIGFAGAKSNNADVNVGAGAIYQQQNAGHKNSQSAKIGVVH